MGLVLGAILAVEAVALVLLFPKLKQRLLQRKDARERFLHNLQDPIPPIPPGRKDIGYLLSPSDWAPSRKSPYPAGENQFPHIVSHEVSSAPSRLRSDPDETVVAIRTYIGLESRAEASAIYAEAQSGNRVAQFIVGMALQKSGGPGAEDWLRLSADQDFEPAQNHLEEAG